MQVQDAWQTIGWREGTNTDLGSRFAAVRVRPASRAYNLTTPRAEEWLLIEWPEGGAEPLKYWLSTLAAEASLAKLVSTATALAYRARLSRTQAGTRARPL